MFLLLQKELHHNKQITEGPFPEVQQYIAFSRFLIYIPLIMVIIISLLALKTERMS
jgi:hypothetical protein